MWEVKLTEGEINRVIGKSNKLYQNRKKNIINGRNPKTHTTIYMSVLKLSDSDALHLGFFKIFINKHVPLQYSNTTC
jgi:hypothetical protein